MNIRQCLGEGVPTAVFHSTAHKILLASSQAIPSLRKIKELVEKHKLSNTELLLRYLHEVRPPFVIATKLAEIANAKRLADAAYYTREDLCFNLVADLAEFAHKKAIRILELAVGVGNFLPVLFEKYKIKQHVKLDLMDRSPDSIRILK